MPDPETLNPAEPANFAVALRRAGHSQWLDSIVKTENGYARYDDRRTCRAELTGYVTRLADAPDWTAMRVAFHGPPGTARCVNRDRTLPGSSLGGAAAALIDHLAASGFQPAAISR